MPLRTISALLGASDELKTLSAGARRLRALQQLYAGLAPPDLAGSSRVKAFKAGTLVLAADNAAAAAKLRQMTGGLREAIGRSAPDVVALRVEVQVGGALHERVPPSQKVPLSPEAVGKFAELSQRMPDGGLKNALRKLVKHHSAARKSVKR